MPGLSYGVACRDTRLAIFVETLRLVGDKTHYDGIYHASIALCSINLLSR